MDRQRGSSNKQFRVSGHKSRSPPTNKTEIDIAAENINEIAVINQANINKVKEFMDHVATKSSALNNKKISAIKNANSLKALKDSGFFNFDFFDSRAQTSHFQITPEEIERVFKLIDKKHGGAKVSLKELESKMAIINPNFPKDQIGTLTNGKSEIKAAELYELLKDNELADFDPITEVYKILDKDKENNLNIDHLQRIFQELGMGRL